MNDIKEQVLEALYLAIPYVEDTATGCGYNDSHILNVLRKMNVAIILLEKPE